MFTGWMTVATGCPPAGLFSPLRKTEPDRPASGQALEQIVGVAVPRGRSLRQLRIGSAAEVFDFRGSLEVAAGLS